MWFRKNQIIQEICENISYLSCATLSKNSINLFDDNRAAQDFYCKLFKLLFWYEDLIDLDILHEIWNFPWVDLGSTHNKIAIQVTSDNSSSKIKDTIKKFIEHKLYETYDRLVFIFIGKKKKYSKPFDTKNYFEFDNEKDIWDDDYIIKVINGIEDLDMLSKIKKFLEEELIEYKYTDNLIDDDIASAINILARDFWSNDVDLIPKIQDRGWTDFIKSHKNPLNRMSWDFFKSKISGHLKYWDSIIKFLSNPVNIDFQKKYFQVCDKIQKEYEDNQDLYESFESVIEKIYDDVNLRYSDNFTNKIKIQIVIHNMYFNCDIWLNP